VLAVEVLDIKFRTNWGWNAQRPLAGTLPEDFPFYRLTHIPIDSNRGVATMPWGLEIDLKPFFGIMGVAPPPEWGQCSSIEPRAFGGNIDNKPLQYRHDSLPAGVRRGRPCSRPATAMACRATARST